MRTILTLSLGVILGSAALSAAGQTLPAPPSGFQIPSDGAANPLKAAGVGDQVEAIIANEHIECFSDPKILFAYGWTLNPAGKTFIDMMIKVPQDPAEKSPMGFFDEPISKQAYKGGVLEWRKQTWPVIAGHACKDKEVVFYEGRWTGYAGNKLIGISVARLYNSKGSGQAWIDEYIDKVTGALNSK